MKGFYVSASVAIQGHHGPSCCASYTPALQKRAILVCLYPFSNRHVFLVNHYSHLLKTWYDTSSRGPTCCSPYSGLPIIYFLSPDFVYFVNCMIQYTIFVPFFPATISHMHYAFPPYILILTYWGKSFRKTLWIKVKLLKLSNFTFFHNVFYAIGIIKSFNSHISVVVCSFFKFGMVSKWCIRYWIKSCCGTSSWRPTCHLQNLGLPCMYMYFLFPDLVYFWTLQGYTQ